ncbi:MAG TPA: circularly permuted type 2 ATP-grasp protein, partial [Methylotenera sp.]|nr:circularly permuted type 2 ATP-grasp protein [Methylotenera sp.]
MEHASKTFFDEMHLSPSTVRDLYAKYSQWLGNVSGSKLESRRQEAELLFRRVGITFNVYGEQAETERLIPFDVIPRILAASEWKVLSSGVIQRVKALNMFLHDIYHQREIIKAGIISDSILRHAQYRPEMINVDVPNGIYAHIAGVDIVRTAENQFYVLEDNLRTPSGVSYMLE